MTMTDLVPTALHRSEDELPFVDIGDGSLLQLIQVDLSQGIWVVRTKFRPGLTVPRHKHTGAVYAFTQTGRWYYKEYPETMNTAGSFLYEPAGSVHTLTVPDDVEGDTDVWFVIHGANLNLDADDNVEVVIDAHGMLALYRAFCAEIGVDDPPVLVKE